MTEKPKPKPCPFCDVATLRPFYHLGHRYGCMGCGALGPAAETPGEAIEAWNKAPRESDVQEFRYALKDVSSLDAAVAGGFCWCNEDDPLCVTPQCIINRDLLGRAETTNV